MDTNWEHFGYKTNAPCQVCGKEGDNQSEPRFGYVVCESHYRMPPSEVSRKSKSEEGSAE